MIASLSVGTLSQYIPSYLQVPTLGWSPCRGRPRPDPGYQDDVYNLVRYWASITTSPYKQDVSALIEGLKGKGKSYTGLGAAINTAKWVAEFLGDDWRDHFDMERTVAIVDPQQANEVTANTSKYDVRLFDDISLAWSARDWQSQDNKDRNDIMLINRIDNTCNILTTPNSKLIDVVPRSNVNFKGEMDTPYFAYGYTSVKIFEPIPMFRATSYKVMDPYLKAGRDKYVLYFFERPATRYTDEYDRIRKIMTDKVKRERHDSLMGIKPETQPAKSIKKVHPKVAQMEERIHKIAEGWQSIRVSGGSWKEFQQYAKQDHGISLRTLGEWKRSGVLVRMGLLDKT